MIKPTVIDLKLPLPGFYEFFSSWLLRVGGKNIVVDPGSTATIDHLVSTLRSKGVAKIDYLLLTHIHLDHAGGTGKLVKEIPVKQVICHEKAIAHLIDPSRLWEGSLQTLGKLAEIQGEPLPVPRELLCSDIDFQVNEVDIQIFRSPGHAAHHISFLIEDGLFVGEALGVVVPGHPNYLRPATPPRFFPDVYIDSIRRLAEVKCKQLYFGHFGDRRRDASIFENALKQIELWMRIIKDAGEDESLPNLLMKQDPHFAPFMELSLEVQQREERFVENSITGIQGYYTS